MNYNELEECREFINLLRQLDEKNKRYVLYMLLGANFAAEAEEQ